MLRFLVQLNDRVMESLMMGSLLGTFILMCVLSGLAGGVRSFVVAFALYWATLGMSFLIGLLTKNVQR